MNIQQAYEYVQEHRPEIIHLSGKTSTGKSTFANQLNEAFGYKIIELDQVVLSAVIIPYNLKDEGQAFVEVYKNRDQTDLVDSFIHAAREKMAAARADDHPVVLDGAIANPQTLKQLLGELEDGIIVYLHPASLTNYRRNLTSRFRTATPANKAGLPAKFWAMIDPAEFANFCERGDISPRTQHAIERYAVESQIESLKRIESLKANFNNIIVVSI